MHVTSNTSCGRSQNMEREYKLMAYGRKCGLGKCHPLPNIHPSCRAYCANQPTALPLHASVLLFKAEAEPTAYLLFTSTCLWAEDTMWANKWVKKQLIVWRKLSSLQFLQHKTWGWKWCEVRPSVWTRAKPQTGFVGCWGARTRSCGLSSHSAETWFGWILLSFWSHRVVCRKIWSREAWYVGLEVQAGRTAEMVGTDLVILRM